MRIAVIGAGAIGGMLAAGSRYPDNSRTLPVVAPEARIWMRFAPTGSSSSITDGSEDVARGGKVAEEAGGQDLAFRP